MVIDKKYMTDAIAEEIEDRSTAETDAEELEGLALLLGKVVRDEVLDADEYLWLAYLVANKREAELRDELES